MEPKSNLKTKWSELPLFWESTYEFVAPYDFDECIRRINLLDAKYRDEQKSLSNFVLSPERLEVSSQQDNGGVFNFKMSGSARKVMLDAQLNGQLFHQREGQTHVKIRVGFTWLSTTFLIILLPIVCMVIYAKSSNDPSSLAFAVCIYGFVLLLQFFFGYPLKSALYHDLHKALITIST